MFGCAVFKMNLIFLSCFSSLSGTKETSNIWWNIHPPRCSRSVRQTKPGFCFESKYKMMILFRATLNQLISSSWIDCILLYGKDVKHKAWGAEMFQQRLQSSPVDIFEKSYGGYKIFTFNCIFIHFKACTRDKDLPHGHSYYTKLMKWELNNLIIEKFPFLTIYSRNFSFLSNVSTLK